MAIVRKRLGDILVAQGLLTEADLQETLNNKPSDQKLGDALLQRGIITERQLIDTLEVQLGIPYVSLFRYPFDPKLFNVVPKDFAKRKLLVPLKTVGDRLFIAMNDPTDFITIDDLRLTTGFHIEPAIASKEDIVKTIAKYYDEESYDELLEDMPQTAEEQQNELDDSDAPIVRLVNQLLSNAVSQKASDIHLDPQENRVLVRYRIDGTLRTERTLPKSMQQMMTARIKILSNLDITENRIPQDGRIKTTVDFRAIDLRVSSLPTVFGEKIVMRILDLSQNLTDISKLGFSELNMQRFMREISKPNGIVLISGPTGSGKSSTLYAALNKLNSEEVNVITVEDPVEYQLEGINQIQVNANVGLTFAAGLRSILRQDPDIVMVGEIRDKETADISIRASLTGHLVLSTIHTNDSIASITRLMDMGIEPFLVTASLNAVIAQRLIRRVCRDCKELQSVTVREKEIAAKRGIHLETIARGKGCPACNMSGYKGRMAIHEVLVVDEDIKDIINRGGSAAEIREIAIKNKTIFLIDDGLLKVKEGMTTTEEVLRVAMTD
ncbi:type II secretory pathway, ATPase PulE/Tfp pilus assembly pathway, ATPase PilB [Planococcus donghaensis MPA1U2]|uniref:Type II secretory pathway, ATPase PulE/Tfp pilus assembly pathway, ATPase PilB n=1 Tax=Planococcus donghaensis MPA1U2 TaxID=933115 RepID=E7RII8_9BACL|nr:ATPase, T2SS/T4P/T4SS family [Planococcus donghaensis]EGA89094.1 type II secretory pathway, ATPase PulE/Tfp pilus assembly pathway, ATPase PilB [Planococcus donghaensis MPA1U2]